MGRPVSIHIVHYAIAVIIANPSLSSPRVPRCLIWNFSRSQVLLPPYQSSALRALRYESDRIAKKGHSYVFIIKYLFAFHRYGYIAPGIGTLHVQTLIPCITISSVLSTSIRQRDNYRETNYLIFGIDLQAGRPRKSRAD